MTQNKELPNIKDIFQIIQQDIDLNLNECPVCKQIGFWVKDNYCRCFKPDCLFTGDTVTYIEKVLNKSKSDALKFIHTRYKPIQDNDPALQSRLVRRNMLNQIFNILVEEGRNNKKVQEYIKSRGWDVPYTTYGYYPSGDFLHKEHRIPKEHLNNLKLLNSRGNESFSNRIIFPIRDIDNSIVYIQGRSLDPEDKLRWLTSSNSELELSVFSYFYNNNTIKELQNECLFVCEGISDALSLETIGVNVISSLNLYPPLFKNKRYLYMITIKLVLVYLNIKAGLQY